MRRLIGVGISLSKKLARRTLIRWRTSLPLHLLQQPDACVTPMALDGYDRNSQHLGNLFVAETCEKSQLNDLRDCLRIRIRVVSRPGGS